MQSCTIQLTGSTYEQFSFSVSILILRVQYFRLVIEPLKPLSFPNENSYEKWLSKTL